MGKRGSNYIVCIIDHLTRWGEAIILVVSTSKVLKMLRDWVRGRCWPEVLMTEGKSYFQSQSVKNWVAEGKVNLLRMLGHHHRANGIMERY